jgi:acetoin:2,6-dichlorophenolindophenol oxidoreductase subunit alpha
MIMDEAINIKGSTLVSILRSMMKIRIFEERVAEIAKNEEIQCPVHLYVGQEAIASSVCANLTDSDYVYSTHRSHGHYLAKGGDVNKIMAEIYCRETGCSRGRGGSMHVIDRKVGFMLSSPIVGGSIPIAVGSALAAKMKGKGQVSVTFFGDGATDEGVFYESLNFAIVNKLPILFVCENNGFSTHLPDFVRQSNTCVIDRINGFKINTARVDGNNPFDVYNTSKLMIERARQDLGPSLIECTTYRWLSHVGYWQDLDVGYRKKVDVEHWMKRDPIDFLSRELIRNEVFTEGDFTRMKKELQLLVDNAVDFAKNSPSPHPSTINEGLFS